MQTRSEQGNNRGVAVFDVTEPARFRPCFRSPRLPYRVRQKVGGATRIGANVFAFAGIVDASSNNVLLVRGQPQSSFSGAAKRPRFPSLFTEHVGSWYNALRHSRKRRFSPLTRFRGVGIGLVSTRPAYLDADAGYR